MDFDKVEATSSPLSRVSSLPARVPSSRDRSNSGASSSAESNGGSSSLGRRPSTSGWLKSLGSRLIHGTSTSAADGGAIRRVHTSSSVASYSDDEPSSPRPPSPRASSPRAVPSSGGGLPINSFKKDWSFDGTTKAASSAPIDGGPLSSSSSGGLRNRLRALSGSSVNTAASSPGGASSAPIIGRRRSSATEASQSPSVRSSMDTSRSASVCPKPALEKRPRTYGGKHVGFAPATFIEDPPQRIPPMSPRKGNVEFLSTGELVVKPMPTPHLYPYYPYLERNHVESSQTAMQRAHSSATKLHSQLRRPSAAGLFGGGRRASVSDHGTSTSAQILAVMTAPTNDERCGNGNGGDDDDDEGDEDMDAAGPKTDIDSLRTVAPSARLGSTTSSSGKKKMPTPDIIYTRCCHLREIMPIKNILRQLQGQLAPIPTLMVANTKPALIEIYAFSDFLTVVPVVSLSLDNHILTAEMVALLLAGLTRSRDIAKIGLANTQLDADAWTYLCRFLANQRGNLLSLDLSCTNPTPLGDRLPAFTRTSADWKQLSDALAAKSGLEELILDGTKISGEDLQLLIHNGFKNGRFLSVARNDLVHEDIQAICDWANAPDSNCIGVNMSENDLSNEWPNVSRLLRNSKLFRLSLSNAKLSGEHAASFGATLTPELTSVLQLRQLDLSGNKNLLKMLLPRLLEVLPKLQFLSRLHIGNNGFSSDDIVSLSSSLCHCHRLAYVSLTDTPPISEAAATALCVAVNLSHSICTLEIDTSSWPRSLQQRLTRYCLANLESGAMGDNAATPKEDEPEHEELLNFRQELIAVTEQVESKGPDITPATMEKVVEIRDRVRDRMRVMLQRKQVRPLTEKDRMLLIRLFFVDSSLDRLYKMCAEQAGVPLQNGGDTRTEEVVSRMGEDDLRPSMSRRASTSSQTTLKQQEQEEGAVHKIASAIMRSSGEQIGSEGSTEEILGQVRKLHADDLEKMIN